MITKPILKKEDHYIQFTENEMKKLNIQPGDKFTCKIENGGVLLEKHVPVELDLESFDKDVLVFLIQESCNLNLPVDEVISQLLEQAFKQDGGN